MVAPVDLADVPVGKVCFRDEGNEKVEDEEDEDEGENVEEAETQEEKRPSYQLAPEEGQAAKEVDSAELQLHRVYDQAFSSIHRLNELRKPTTGVMYGLLELNANELIVTALAELLVVEENLHQEVRLFAGVKPADDYSVGALDTMRYFITGVAGVTITGDDGGGSVLLPPNASTTTGWALLQTMYQSMMCNIVESMPPPPKTVEDGGQWQDDQLKEQRLAIRSSEEYVEAKSFFLSLFTWPALLASPSISHSEQVELKLQTTRARRKAEVDKMEDDEGGEVKLEDGQVSKRTRGRPHKRTFYFASTSIDFVRIRARQVPFFATLHQADLLERLHQKSYYELFQRHNSRHWPSESPDSLRNRVKLFVDAVWAAVDGRFEAKAGREKKTKRRRREDEAAAPKKVIKYPEEKVQVVPLRKSTRSRVVKLPSD